MDWWWRGAFDVLYRVRVYLRSYSWNPGVDRSSAAWTCPWKGTWGWSALTIERGRSLQLVDIRMGRGHREPTSTGRPQYLELSSFYKWGGTPGSDRNSWGAACFGSWHWDRRSMHLAPGGGDRHPNQTSFHRCSWGGLVFGDQHE